jgi:hypothetical protein
MLHSLHIKSNPLLRYFPRGTFLGEESMHVHYHILDAGTWIGNGSNKRRAGLTPCSSPILSFIVCIWIWEAHWRIQHCCTNMQILRHLLFLALPAFALCLSSQAEPPCNVDECTDVIDQSGCWNFARSKKALLGCVPGGSVGVSWTIEGYICTDYLRSVLVMGVIETW